MSYTYTSYGLNRDHSNSHISNEIQHEASFKNGAQGKCILDILRFSQTFLD